MNQYGYKQTEIGVIPEDWDCAKFGEKVKIYRGGSPRPIQEYLTTSSDGINWIKIGDVGENDKYICSTQEKIISEGVSKSREVHIGDFTSDSSWGGTAAKAGKFPGMVETGTKYSGVSTGIDHLKELGITHVQLLPFYDYATKNNTSLSDIYNWGYDPVNYNVPEDRFSTCPSDYVERIREVKEMINEFHKNGIRVIMDVVYNHTYDKEMFKNISTKYYTTTDLSGCGNSINTGVPMVSRMIRDSLEYWVDEYNIDGFRFDLIGIYHTSAVKDWGNYMNNTKFPDRMLLMYGEPWNGYATDNEESQKVRMSAVSSLTSAKVGVFNGKYRQSLKGSNDTGKRGYIFNQNEDDGTAYAANIAVGLKGSLTSLDKSNCSDISGTWTRFFAGTPDQSINYISAHDNLCLWDKIKEAGVTGDYAQRIVKFGHGILLTSQGIPFIHAGDEFLRTKHKGKGSSMAHNSYMAGIETNSIDWKLKSTNNGIFKYHADLFKLRKDNDGLRYRKGTGSTTISGNAVNYYVQNTNGTKLCIVVNPGNPISNPVSGKTIFDINGLSPKTSNCEGTAVTVIKY
jgi:pullulanase/glycogen debranching enzyme